MNWFQIIALIVVSILFVLSLIPVLRSWATRKESLIWVLVWLLAGVAIAKPGLTSTVAKALGIGRGADLILYCSVVVMLVGFLMVYTRLRRIRRELTLIVRHLAIRDAVVTSPAEQAGTASEAGPLTDASQA